MLHFLSSTDWLSFQKELGRKTWRLDDLFSANIIQLDLRFGKNYLYIPRGPVLNEKSLTVTEALNQEGFLKSKLLGVAKEIKHIAEKEKSLFIKVEPGSDFIAKALVEAGFQRSKKSVQPYKTVVLDLKKNEDKLWKSLSHGNRYNIKYARKNNIAVREVPAEQFDSLWTLFKDTAQRDAFHLHEKEYYEKLCSFHTNAFSTKLFAAYREEEPVAAAIVGFYKKQFCYYLHSASSQEHLQFKPTFVLNWEIIKSVKEKGYSQYDLYGIDAKRIPGVTKFKLSFGGRVIEYPGPFDLPISKVLVYSLLCLS